jgi:hypothetical protein
MLRRIQRATQSGFSDDGVAERVSGRRHPLEGQDTAIKRIRQLQETPKVFI